MDDLWQSLKETQNTKIALLQSYVQTTYTLITTMQHKISEFSPVLVRFAVGIISMISTLGVTESHQVM